MLSSCFTHVWCIAGLCRLGSGECERFLAQWAASYLSINNASQEVIRSDYSGSFGMAVDVLLKSNTVAAVIAASAWTFRAPV